MRCTFMASSDSGAMWPVCCSTSFIQFGVNVLVSRKVTCAVHVQHLVITFFVNLFVNVPGGNADCMFFCDVCQTFVA